MTLEQVQLRRLKQEIRAKADANRQNQPNKDLLSGVACKKFAGLLEYTAAETVMLYVSFGSEVCTRRFLVEALSDKQRVAVPYCSGGALELFGLMSMEELAPGTYGILEPKVALRSRGNRRANVRELDLIMVPGVAFDRKGGRLGHGKGYYDRLLAGVRPDALVVGVGFECQMFPEIPMMPKDVYMDRVITEKGVCEGRP